MTLPDRHITDRDAPASPLATPPVVALARAIGLAEGHGFADLRTMTPAPNTCRIAKVVLAYLFSDGWLLVRRDDQ